MKISTRMNIVFVNSYFIRFLTVFVLLGVLFFSKLSEKFPEHYFSWILIIGFMAYYSMDKWVDFINKEMEKKDE